MVEKGLRSSLIPKHGANLGLLILISVSLLGMLLFIIFHGLLSVFCISLYWYPLVMTHIAIWKITIFNGKIQLFLWPCSIANCSFTGGYIMGMSYDLLDSILLIIFINRKITHFHSDIVQQAMFDYRIVSHI